MKTYLESVTLHLYSNSQQAVVVHCAPSNVIISCGIDLFIHRAHERRCALHRIPIQ